MLFQTCMTILKTVGKAFLVTNDLFMNKNNIINVFTVTFDQFNASMLNKSIHFLKNIHDKQQTFKQ